MYNSDTPTTKVIQTFVATKTLIQANGVGFLATATLLHTFSIKTFFNNIIYNTAYKPINILENKVGEFSCSIVALVPKKAKKVLLKLMEWVFCCYKNLFSMYHLCSKCYKDVSGKIYFLRFKTFGL